jgi:serine/threonine protein kinase
MARLHHPSIVTLYGVCRERKSGMLMLVQELLLLGSALDYTLSKSQEVLIFVF